MHAWQKLGLLGDDPVLQFVNTVDDAGKSRSEDGMPDWVTLVGWAEATGILSDAEAVSLIRPADGAAAESELRAVHALREATWQVLRPESVDDDRSHAAAARVSEEVRWSFERAEFDSDQRDFRWRAIADDTDPTVLRVRLGLEVERFLLSEERRRVKECGRCTALFLDHGRGRGRIWCRMSTCGNRAKVSRFRSKE